MEYEKILNQYLNCNIENVDLIETGHINRTFLVNAGGRYILQCLNKSLYSGNIETLQGNYLIYKNACAFSFKSKSLCLAEWNCPEWIISKDGKYIYVDEIGNIYRMYRYLEGNTLSGDVVNSYYAGKGLGMVHRILRKCEGIKSVHPDLYNIKKYYENYLNISEYIYPSINEIEEIIKRDIVRFLDLSDSEKHFIHGDAKISNMIWNGDEVIGFIDLDTLMYGSRLDDIADCMRSCCSDEFYNLIPDKFSAFLEGYELGLQDFLSKERRDLLIRFYYKNRFMLGLRYYTDYLSGNVYFAESYKGECLDKAKKLLL